MNAIDTIAKAMETLYGEDWENLAYSPYAIAAIINQTFQDLGSDKQIAPQMMYNYARAGMINKIKGQRQYTAEDTAAFVIRFVNRNM